MSAIPLPPHRLPALDPLINGDLWSRWAGEGRVFPLDDFRVAVRYLRLKPETSCRLGVISTSGGKGENPPEGCLLHLYPDRERAEVAFAKLTRRESFVPEDGFAPFLDEETPTIVAPFPNDPELPSLRYVYDPTRFRRTLSRTRPPAYPKEEWRLQKRHIRTELLAYKPGRRAVFRVRVGVRHLERDEKVRLFWHIKVGTPEITDRNLLLAEWFSEAVGDRYEWRVPRPWGYSQTRSMVSTEWVPGEPLEGDPTHLERVGRALGELHGLSADASGLPTAFDAPAESAALASLAKDLAHLVPEATDRWSAVATTLAERLAPLFADPATVVHGDFHRDQVVIDEGRVVIVDLDNAGLGVPLLDVAAFCASRIEQGRASDEDEAFLTGYRTTGRTVEESTLSVAIAHQLFRRAIFPFRDLHPDWPTELLRRLEQVEEILSDK